MTPPTNSSARGAWGWAYLFALLIVPAIGWYELLEPFGRDQGIHATIAYALKNGLVTYRDVFNIKPPLTTAVHWLSQVIFGHSMMAIRALDLVFVTLTALCLVEIGRRLGRGLIYGFAVPVSFAALYFSLNYWNHAQTDGWAGMLVAPALLLMILGWGRPAGAARLGLMAAAGAVLGLAFGLKYTIGGMGILVFAPLLAGWIGRDQARFRLADLGAVVAGGLAVLLAIIAVMAAVGALEPFLEIQNFIRGYVGYEPEKNLPLWEVLRLRGAVYSYLLYGVILGLFTALVIWRRDGRALALVIAIFWMAAGWLSGHVQGKGFGYHYLPLLPAYAFALGLLVEGLASLPSSARMRTALTVVLLGVVFLPSRTVLNTSYALLAMRQPDPLAATRALVFKGSDFDIEANVEFADLLKARRKPGDGLFVWGYTTMLYFLVDEPPRYRYPYSWPFLVSFYDGRYTQDLLERLQVDPPEHFVVQLQDATPWVTYNEKDSEQALEDFPQIAAFLNQNYTLIETRPRFKLYELKGK